jgi:hypothetical protein
MSVASVISSMLVRSDSALEPSNHRQFEQLHPQQGHGRAPQGHPQQGHGFSFSTVLASNSNELALARPAVSLLRTVRRRELIG